MVLNDATPSAYLKHFVLPNFFFHIVTAYNLLRQAGVDIGKMDYLLGPQNIWLIFVFDFFIKIKTVRISNNYPNKTFIELFGFFVCWTLQFFYVYLESLTQSGSKTTPRVLSLSNVSVDAATLAVQVCTMVVG